ncbi:hypothetical protein PTSG_08473 [Salpingoeca rosetta]|uniref:Beta-lactamase-related domain-containing protein n=1 Tax=Salpingoeca rosetta (strain ATCC 50818 / BSB-021) TaxID=946362 RepID=F2UJS8_SALR5|nr:uncharacterized protein PTSG_08473 [Salpingoeca rosetta]EGD77377.1 hypothetical protein PTSG_08473 [Salpingoeca rosetta]|eukprot:XP_004990721.1 hypothetical protein PTSG_08473 [Salpingoeca rosetta]
MTVMMTSERKWFGLAVKAVVAAVAVAVLAAAWTAYAPFVRDVSTIAASALAMAACNADRVQGTATEPLLKFEVDQAPLSFGSVWHDADLQSYEARFLAANASAVYVSRLHGCVLQPLSPHMQAARDLYHRAVSAESEQDAAEVGALQALLAQLRPGGPRQTQAHTADKDKEISRGSRKSGESQADDHRSSSSSSDVNDDANDDDDGTGYFGDTALCSDDERLSEEEIAALQAIFDAEIKRGEQQQEHTRGLAAVHCGKLVAESYASWLNITADSAQLGWSMSKSVLSTLIGVAIGEGRIKLEDLLDLDMDESVDNDLIQLRHLLHMVDGLDYNEHYCMINDPARMLFLERSTAGFARNKAPAHLPGERWCYNSGATNLASWMLRQSFPSWWDYWRFPYEKLFAPIGAKSFVLETDSEGIFVGSSFGFATARDWARFGVLHLQNGTWRGSRVVPSQPDPYPTTYAFNDGVFADGWWYPPQGHANITRLREDPTNACLVKYLEMWGWATNVLPAGTAFSAGYKGQYIFVVPPLHLVLVRLGNGWQDEVRNSVVKQVLDTVTRASASPSHKQAVQWQ